MTLTCTPKVQAPVLCLVTKPSALFVTFSDSLYPYPPTHWRFIWIDALSGWTDEELSAAVTAYRQMLEKQVAGTSYVKKEIYQSLVDKHGRTEGAWQYRMQNISALLHRDGKAWVNGLPPAQNVGTSVAARLLRLMRTDELITEPEYKYGERHWEVVLAAIEQLGGRRTAREVSQHLGDSLTDFNRANVSPDLGMLSVNEPSRLNHSGNTHPRRSDSGHELDRLFMIKDCGPKTYELYNPEEHGVWEIYPAPTPEEPRKLAVRSLSGPGELTLSGATKEAEDEGAFDPHSTDGARKRVLQSVVRRRGQPAFRAALIAAYGGRCAITDCDAEPALEAAHIVPYSGDQTNVLANGLLLRADIHTLFDLHELTICAQTMKVQLGDKLRGTSYGALHGGSVRTPSSATKPSKEALALHNRSCAWWSDNTDQ